MFFSIFHDRSPLAGWAGRPKTEIISTTVYLDVLWGSLMNGMTNIFLYNNFFWQILNEFFWRDLFDELFSQIFSTNYLTNLWRTCDEFIDEFFWRFFVPFFYSFFNVFFNDLLLQNLDMFLSKVFNLYYRIVASRHPMLLI